MVKDNRGERTEPREGERGNGEQREGERENGNQRERDE